MADLAVSGRTLGETEWTRQRERQLIKTLAARLSSVQKRPIYFEQLPPYFQDNYSGTQLSGAKYKIDGYLFDNTKTIVGWVEAKWYGDNKAPYCAINVPKFLELCNLSRELNIPSYFVCRRSGAWGYCVICDYGFTIGHRVEQGGGTPKHREKNHDDVEPLVFLNKDEFLWFEV